MLLNPPLYVTLTTSEKGERCHIAVHRIHIMEGPITDTENLRRYTVVKTWMDHGILTPQGLQTAWNEIHVKETPEEIQLLIQEAVGKYLQFAKEKIEEDRWLN